MGMAQTFTGVIYLHEITQARLQGTPLRLLKEWCNTRGIKNIVLATTKWNEVPKELGKHREPLLEGEWRNTMQEGPVCRLHNTSNSARDVGRLIPQQVTASRGVGKPMSNSPDRPSKVRNKEEGSGHHSSYTAERVRDRRRPEDENRDTGSLHSIMSNSVNTTLLNPSRQRLGIGGTNGGVSSGGSVSSGRGGGQQTRSINGSGSSAYPSGMDSHRSSFLCCRC